MTVGRMMELSRFVLAVYNFSIQNGRFLQFTPSTLPINLRKVLHRNPLGITTITSPFPKKIDFESITDDKVLFVMDRLNNRPRKTPGFATPNEMFFASLNKKAA